MDLSMPSFRDTDMFGLSSRRAILKNCHTGESRYPVFFEFWMPDQVRHDEIYRTNNSSHLRDTTLDSGFRRNDDLGEPSLLTTPSSKKNNTRIG
jgi:hypothetical protein